MGMATRVCVDNYEAYPGIFRVSFDSGDVRAAVVLTRPQLEQLRSCVVGSFPDVRRALMLICARVRYVTSSEWSTRRYLDMSRLGENV